MLSEMPLPSGTGWTILGFIALAFIVVMYFIAASAARDGGSKFLGTLVGKVIGYVVDAPFVYVKVAVGFAILKWLGWL